MKTVAVLGGGPAGSFAAERLARAGLKTIVFDEKLAWEKPCGGGLTYKAYQRVSVSDRQRHAEEADPRDDARRAERRRSEDGADAAAGDLFAPGSEPHAAGARGASRARRSRRRACWASSGASAAGGCARKRASPKPTFCIVATGARNPLREVGHGVERGRHHERAGLLRAGVAGAHRYSVSAAARRLHLGVPALRASFGRHLRQGRTGAIAAGAAGSVTWTSAASRGKGATFYSHMLPSLESPGWKKNRVAGEGWMAVGDAGGLVDPITGEGLYYAMRSGDLASQVVLDDAHGIAGKGGGVSGAAGARIRARIWNSRRRSPSACSWARSCSARCPRGWSNSCGAARGSAT